MLLLLVTTVLTAAAMEPQDSARAQFAKFKARAEKIYSSQEEEEHR